MPEDELQYPKHIAFIMDGNGRWAQRQGLMRINGHEQGAEVLRSMTRHCRANGVAEATYYALSTENFSRRPKLEVRQLMKLLKKFLIDERAELMEQDIQLKSIGRVWELPEKVQKELRETEKLTAQNKSMVLRLALNYGARQELLDAMQGLFREKSDSCSAQGESAGSLTDACFAKEHGENIKADRVKAEASSWTEEDLRAHMYDPTMSDPDLMIRTAGEFRVSNFLLWQISYSEIYVVEETWPQFTVEGLKEAVASYQTRDRKYGRVSTRAIPPMA